MKLKQLENGKFAVIEEVEKVSSIDITEAEKTLIVLEAEKAEHIARYDYDINKWQEIIKLLKNG